MARYRQESITTVAALQAKVSPITKHTPGGSTLQAPSKTQQETLLDDVRLQAKISKRKKGKATTVAVQSRRHTHKQRKSKQKGYPRPSRVPVRYITS